MSSINQMLSTDQEARRLSLTCGLKGPAIIDWIVSNKEDFPFLLTPKFSTTGKQCSYTSPAPSLSVGVLNKEKEKALLSVAQLKCFHFDDSSLSLHGDYNTIRCCAILMMFRKSGVFDYFGMDEEVVLKWLSVVRNDYNKHRHPYHNWANAFSVTQTVFSLISSFNLSRILSTTDKLVMLIAALCHGVCHLNQVSDEAPSRIADPLLNLYSTQWDDFTHMEYLTTSLHHRKDCNIFEFLNSGEEMEILDAICTASAAADFTHVFVKLNELNNLVQNDEFAFDSTDHRALFRSLAVSACCLAWLGKPWSMHVKMSEAVVRGLEGNQNAEKWFIERQCGLFNTVLPLFEVLSIVDEYFESVRQGVISNRDTWLDVLSQDVECLSNPQITNDIITNADLPTCTHSKNNTACDIDGNTLPSPHTEVALLEQSAVDIQVEEHALSGSEEIVNGDAIEVTSEPVSPRKQKRGYLKRLRKFLRKLFHVKKGSSSRN